MVRAVRARARTIDGSLLIFQDAAMKVVVDGLTRVTTKRGDAEARRVPRASSIDKNRMRHDVTGLIEHADRRCTHWHRHN